MSVVDAGDFSKIENWSMDPDKFSNRVSSLTNESCQFLKGEENTQVIFLISRVNSMARYRCMESRRAKQNAPD